MAEFKNLARAYALETPEDNKVLYADWAQTYDSEFIEANGYVLHLNVASAFVAAGGEGPVLDVGAGTGVCGQALQAKGITHVDATDISQEMLDVAGEKQVYQRRFTGDLLDRLDVADGHYPGIVSSGTFTLGHVGPEGLDEVVRMLAPKGLAVIAVRDVHYDSAGFADKLAQLESHFSEIRHVPVRIYAEGTGGAHEDDKSILLHLTKAG